MSEDNTKNGKESVKTGHDHAGHRQRILKKLEQGVLLDHELLESLLFYAIPRRNTNDLAHRLISEFQSIQGVFNASLEQLKRVDGIGENAASLILCVGMIYRNCIELYRSNIPKVFEISTFSAFVKEEYAKEEREVLDFYLLGANNKILHRQRFSQADFTSVNMQPKDFSALLVDYDPVGFVVVHNHPSGSCVPSEADNCTTAQFQVVASFNNIIFCDHFIYGRDGVYSYYANGEMQKYSQQYSISTLTDKNTRK